jgi:phage major head subunit gpT-like protein
MSSAGTYQTLDNRNLVGLFDQFYEASLNAGLSLRVGTLLGSDMETETYGWLGGSPSMDELKSEAVTQSGLRSFTYALRNKEYATSLLIREKDLRRDKLGQISIRVQEMAAKAAEHWDVLRAAAVIANGTGYDGLAFFANNHLEGDSGTQKNLLTASEYTNLNVGTAAAPTADEMAKIIPDLLGHFHTFKDDQGDPVNGGARNFVIEVGTVALWAPTLHALKANQLTSGASNPVVSVQADGYNVAVALNPRLSSITDSIFAYCTDGPVKPYILQEEIGIDPQMTGTESDEYKKFRRFVFSIYTSRAVGYARWQKAIKATLS